MVCEEKFIDGFNAHLPCAFVMWHPMRMPRAKNISRSTIRGSPTKRATNVSIRQDLLDAAREAGFNLSATLERALTEELAVARRGQWREENRESIEAYNEHVDKYGVLSDGERSF